MLSLRALLLAGGAGSSRQHFPLRACLLKQKWIPQRVRQSHNLVPSPRESTFSSSFINGFHFLSFHRISFDTKGSNTLTSSRCTEQSPLVSEQGCFWSKSQNALKEELQEGYDRQCLGFKLHSTSECPLLRNLNDTLEYKTENELGGCCNEYPALPEPKAMQL